MIFIKGMSRVSSRLFLGGEIDLVLGGVEAAVLGLLASAGTYEDGKVSKDVGSSQSRSRANSPAALDPHWQVDPAGLTFSEVARSQVHSPAGRARHEQRGPVTLFSAVAFSQLQWRADCLPQEHLACWAVM